MDAIAERTRSASQRKWFRAWQLPEIRPLRALALPGAVCVEYAITPCPDHTEPGLRDGEAPLEINGIACPGGRVGYRITPNAIVGGVTLPIHLLAAGLLTVRFAPLAHTVGWGTRRCELLLQIEAGSVEPISARWLRH